MSKETPLSSGELEQLHLSDNGYTVSYAMLIALTPEELSPLSRISREADFVLRIETKEHPDASPFHFWLTRTQLQKLLDGALGQF